MDISSEEREAVYKTIYSRRDVRNEFKTDKIPEEVLMRILNAAHHAPSVGFMQSWDFIIVKDKSTKQKIKNAFSFAHTEAAQLFTAEKRG